VVTSVGPERWIVDGNNVMGSRPDGWWRDRTGAAIRLVHQLAGAGLHRGGEVEVVVVFDGPAPPGGPDRDLSAIEVRHAGASSADDLIVGLVADQPGQPTTVFTSDAELSDRVRELGARVSGARTLLAMIGPGGGSVDRPRRRSQ
jgi:hypothetical protein